MKRRAPSSPKCWPTDRRRWRASRSRSRVGVARLGLLAGLISKVDANSDAAQKGLRDGDVILKAAGQNVFSPQDVVNAVKRTTDEGLSAVVFHIKKGGEGGGQTVLVAVPLGKG